MLWAVGASVVWLALTAALLQVTGAPRGAGLAWTAVVLTIVNAIVEEVPFRGFLLSQLEGRLRFWRAGSLAPLAPSRLRRARPPRGGC